MRELAALAKSEGMPIYGGERAPTSWTPEQRETVAALSGSLAVLAMVRADGLGERAATSERASDARGFAGAARDLAIVAGILTDKAQLLAGQPTTRAERVDTAELLTRLQRVLTGRSMPMALASGTDDPSGDDV